MTDHSVVQPVQDRSASQDDGKDAAIVNVEQQGRKKVIGRGSKISSIAMVLVAGAALFSDGYNAQVVGQMNPVLSALYPDDYTKKIKTSMSNAFLIGEVFGMLFFGWAIDRLGRRTGIFWATFFLVLGIVLATAAHGATRNGMFWMMIIGRGVAGFGAGGGFSTRSLFLLPKIQLTRPVRRRVPDLRNQHFRGGRRECPGPTPPWHAHRRRHRLFHRSRICLCGNHRFDCPRSLQLQAQ